MALSTHVMIAPQSWGSDSRSFRTVFFSVLFAFVSTRRTSSLQRALRALAVCRRQSTIWLSAHAPEGWDSGVGLQFFLKEIEAFVFLFLHRSTSSTGSPCRSLRCTPACWLDFLSYLSTDASRFQCAPDPSRVEGRWQWSSLVAILCTAQPVQSD